MNSKVSILYVSAVLSDVLVDACNLLARGGVRNGLLRETLRWSLGDPHDGQI